jgi:hypothetical protein
MPPCEDAQVMTHRPGRRPRWLLVFGGLLPALWLTAGPSAADGVCDDAAELGWVEPDGGVPPITCVDQLRGKTVAELQSIFACGLCSCPLGYGRGEVLLLANTRHGKMKARMANRVWKGKVFEEDGRFTNQWARRQALDSCYAPGPSWYDGMPCVIMEYPSDTPLFANSHDELRQVGPNVWLGMFYERDSKTLRGFFALECAPEKRKRSHGH